MEEGRQEDRDEEAREQQEVRRVGENLEMTAEEVS